MKSKMLWSAVVAVVAGALLLVFFVPITLSGEESASTPGSPGYTEFLRADWVDAFVEDLTPLSSSQASSEPGTRWARVSSRRCHTPILICAPSPALPLGRPAS